MSNKKIISLLMVLGAEPQNNKCSEVPYHDAKPVKLGEVSRIDALKSKAAVIKHRAGDLFRKKSSQHMIEPGTSKPKENIFVRGASEDVGLWLDEKKYTRTRPAEKDAFKKSRSYLASARTQAENDIIAQHQRGQIDTEALSYKLKDLNQAYKQHKRNLNEHIQHQVNEAKTKPDVTSSTNRLIQTEDGGLNTSYTIHRSNVVTAFQQEAQEVVGTPDSIPSHVIKHHTQSQQAKIVWSAGDPMPKAKKGKK